MSTVGFDFRKLSAFTAYQASLVDPLRRPFLSGLPGR